MHVVGGGVWAEGRGSGERKQVQVNKSQMEKWLLWGHPKPDRMSAL